jgi:hypothetical protein
MTCSNNGLVVKGHTGALFLLSEIVVVALSMGLTDMKSSGVEVVVDIKCLGVPVTGV